MITHTHISTTTLTKTQGLWGMALMLLFVFPLAYALPGSDVGGCVENAWDSLAMVKHSTHLQLILAAFFVSVRASVCRIAVFADWLWLWLWLCLDPCTIALTLDSAVLPNNRWRRTTSSPCMSRTSSLQCGMRYSTISGLFLFGVRN